MEELKLRAWHKDLKVMRQIAEINFLWTPGPNEKELGGTVVVWDHPSVTAAMIKGSTDAWRFEDIVIIRYTGLEDKNGKEIYESNIVRWFDSYNKPHLHVISWSKKWACFDFPMYMTDSKKDFYDMEVIGDIYQNPELLEIYKKS